MNCELTNPFYISQCRHLIYWFIQNGMYVLIGGVSLIFLSVSLYIIYLKEKE